MSGDIDFNAGCVLDGSRTLDQAAESLAELVERVAEGVRHHGLTAAGLMMSAAGKALSIRP